MSDIKEIAIYKRPTPLLCPCPIYWIIFLSIILHHPLHRCLTLKPLLSHLRCWDLNSFILRALWMSVFHWSAPVSTRARLKPQVLIGAAEISNLLLLHTFHNKTQQILLQAVYIISVTSQDKTDIIFTFVSKQGKGSKVKGTSNGTDSYITGLCC